MGERDTLPEQLAAGPGSAAPALARTARQDPTGEAAGLDAELRIVQNLTRFHEELEITEITVTQAVAGTESMIESHGEGDSNFFVHPRSCSIAEATTVLDRAMERSRPGPYQVEAAISAIHCHAPSADETDWQEIAVLYGLLEELRPEPDRRRWRNLLAEGVAFATSSGKCCI